MTDGFDKASSKRSDLIREEMRLAQEFGVVPARPISIARNFRTEGLTRVGGRPLHGQLLSERQLTAPPIGPRKGNPFLRMASSGPLLGIIEDGVKRTDGTTREQLSPELISAYGDFVSRTNEADQSKALQKRVLTAAFGDNFFKQMRGGSAKDHANQK